MQGTLNNFLYPDHYPSPNLTSMPKGQKRQKNSSKRGKAGEATAKPLNLADDEQTYGITTKALGDRKFNVACQDGKERICKVRGKMKNREWVRDGDVVLVSLRDFDDDTGDIIAVYGADEVRRLKREGILLLAVNEAGLVESKQEDRKEDEIPFDFDTI